MQWLMKKLNNTDLFPMAKFWLLWDVQMFSSTMMSAM